MPHLLPNFGPGRAFVSLRIRRIAKLIYIKAAWNFLSESRRNVLIIFRMPARYIRADDAHLSAERAHVEDLLLRHFVGNNEQHAITFRAGDQCKT